MNDETKAASARLQRIKKVSRLFRYFVLANLVFNIGFCALAVLSSSDGIRITVRGLFLSASTLLMFFWFWKLAQLFRFYERGLIFATETIRCIKVLGMICVIGWLTLFAVRFTPRPEPISYNLPGEQKLVKAMLVEKHYFRMGFFSFDFGTGVDFGTLFVGASVMLAAWIMDEGRKMQEEQELTV